MGRSGQKTAFVREPPANDAEDPAGDRAGAPPWVCQRCGAGLEEWLSSCPECRATYAVVQVDGDSSADPDAPRSRSPSDVEVSEPRRARSGFRSLDDVLGGGWVPGFAVLFGGRTGAGKTTLLLCAAQRAKTKIVLLASAEQRIDPLALRCKQLGVDRKGIRLYHATTMDSALEEADRVDARVLILDSATRFRARIDKGPIGSDKQVAAVITRAERWARERGRVVILTSHVSKTHGDIKGSEGLKHDSHLVLDIRRHELDPALRIVTAVKSRQSQSQVHSAWFRELSTGAMVPCDPPKTAPATQRLTPK